MSKIKLTLASLAASLLPVMAFAIDTSIPPAGAITSMGVLLTKIETFMWVVFGGIAIISFVIAGIFFLTAAGDPEKVGKARTFFIWGVVGVVVAIIAYSVIAIVGTALGI